MNLLQGGRGSDAAEDAAARSADGSAPSALQGGRGSDAAEDAFYAQNVTFAIPLQGGRGSDAAEDDFGRDYPSVGEFCFNEAAAVMPRKMVRQFLVDDQLAQLQGGRGSDAAEDIGGNHHL